MSGRLIALSGFKGSGKDAVFLRLAHLGFAPVRLAFADKLKISAMASLGLRHDALGTRRSDEELIALADVLKEDGELSVRVGEMIHWITGRQYLQFKGTEGGRDVFGSSFWVDEVMSQIEADGLTAITDARFPNEAEAILAAGGQVWEVLGPESDTSDPHPSETPLPRELVTLSIDNTVRGDDFAHLDRQLQSLMKG